MKSIGQDLNLPQGMYTEKTTQCCQPCICSLPTKGCGAAASTIPVDCFYVLGDNTEHSYDSRYWVCPFVTLKDIVAKVCAE